MRKKLAFILAIVMMVTVLGACAQKESKNGKGDNKQQEVEKLTAEEIMENCLEKFENVDSMDMSMDMDMDMDINGEQMSQKMTYDIVMNNVTSSELEMAIEMDMDILGEQTKQTIYYQDGMYYMDVQGQKYKMAMDIEEVMDSIGGVNSFSTIKLGDFEELELVDDEDGYRVKFVLNTTAITDMANSMMGEMAAMAEISLDSVEGEYYINGDFVPEEITMEMSMSMVIEGMECSIDAVVTAKYNSIGEYIEIDFPDFSEYEEMSY